MSEAQSDMPEMTNTQEIDSHSRGLPMILMDVVTQSIKEFRSMCRVKAKTLIVPPRTAPKKKGDKMKNPVVAEEKVTFHLPENCNTGSFKDMDKVMAKLGDWKLQSRIRDTKMRDTYYYHISSTQAFRSITEVVNYILPDTYPKFPSRKRSRKGQHEVETPEELKKKPSPTKNSENTEDKEENLELENIPQETLQVAPDVAASVEQEPETHDETIIAIEEDHPHIEQGPETHDEGLIGVEEDLPRIELEPQTHDEAIIDVEEDFPCTELEPQTHDEAIIDVEEDFPCTELEPQTHDEAIIRVEEDVPCIEQEPQAYDDAMIGAEKDGPRIEQEPQTHDEAIIWVEEDHPHVEAINEPMYIGANEDRPQHEDLEDMHMSIGANEDRPQHENFEDIGMYNGANEDRPQHEDLEDISQDFGAYDNVLDTYYDRC